MSVPGLTLPARDRYSRIAMKLRNRQRRPLHVSNSRWMAYAVAGLASAGAAEGAIHYVDPANVILRGNDHATFPLDDLGDKLVFLHQNYVSHPPANSWAGFSVVGRFGASVRQHSIGGSFSFLSNLKRGSLVSQGYLKSSGFGTLAIYGDGEFVQPGIGFIGFAFNNGSGKQYGWARVQMGGGEPGEHKNVFKVLDYAFADPGEPIRAGQRSSDEQAPDQGSTDEQAPDQGSLGGLALGAVGLLAWRKSRAQTARHTKRSQEINT